jgi:hypothetical protein
MPFLAVLTDRLSLLPAKNPEIAPETPNAGNHDVPSHSDKTQHKTAETAETTKNSPTATSASFIDTSQQSSPTQKSTNPLQRISRAVGQILTPKHPHWTHKNKTSHQLPKMSPTLHLL